MAEWDAKEKTELLESEHEVLFIIRDLLKVFINQQVEIHGRTSDEMVLVLAFVEDRINKLSDLIYHNYERVL